MLRVKVSKALTFDDYVAVPQKRSPLSKKHLTAMSGIMVVCALIFMQGQFNPRYLDETFLNEQKALYLASDEDKIQQDALAQISAGSADEDLENYEEYDIPVHQFALPMMAALQAQQQAADYVHEQNAAPARRQSFSATELSRETAQSEVKEQAPAPAPEVNIKTVPQEEQALAAVSVNAQAASEQSAPAPAVSEQAESTAPALSDEQGAVSLAQTAPAAPVEEVYVRPEGTWYVHEVHKGESIAAIFRMLGFPAQNLGDVTRSVEQNKLALNIGDKIYFLMGKNDELLELVKPYRNAGQLRLSRHHASEPFKVFNEDLNAHVEEAQLKTIAQASAMPGAVAAAEQRAQKAEQAKQAAADKSRPRLIIASLQRGETFKSAAKRAGLTPTEIITIENNTKGKYALNKLKAGDSFRVLFDGLGTKALINAVQINSASSGDYAFYRNPQDKGYYREGEYVPTAGIFRRFPLAIAIKINSKFNPHRRHPVTGKVRPHNGVDFKAPVGTPVYAPADGVVTFAGYQRAAGYYVIVRHTDRYSTVYMHLSKIDVKNGQKVMVGEVIAKTGNTGRTTGPHLHYEVRVNDKPVDPLSVQLPKNAHPNLAQAQREAFESNIKTYKAQLFEDSLAQR